jgi:hypothetical protein
MASMSQTDIEIITHSDFVEQLFAPLQPVIRADYPGYRNHVYRVLTYALHFLRGEGGYRRAVEAALVYHDIGMWTDRELAYLEPSEEAAARANAAERWGLEPELIRALIHWHHKLLPFRGPHAFAVNAVRKADWIDATQGRWRKGVDPAQVERVFAAIPPLGFYETLDRMAADLNHGRKFGGYLKVIRRVYKW